MSFNEKLQRLRKENKLSQEQLADMLDVTRQSVSKWESGTTYPEMDKLITMCKIFKCSLDDLTNDEVTEISLEKKNSNLMSSLLDNILEIIHKSVLMFKNMSFKHLISCFCTLFFLGLFLLLFRIPFNFLEDGFYNVVSYIGRPAIIGFSSGLFNLVLDVIYFVLYILVFVYIYKIAYLDRYDFTESDQINETKHVIDKQKEIIKEVKIISTQKNKSNTLFKILGGIAIGFIKFLFGCFALPFLFTLVLLFGFLVIDIYLILNGILYIGILLFIVFGIILNIWLLELVCIFIFNKKASFKRLLWTFIIGIAGIGVASGMTALEITNTELVDEKPIGFESKKIINEYDMKDDLYFFTNSYYSDQINYVIDESLGNDILFEVEYYDEIQEFEIYFNENFINFDFYINDEFYNFKTIIKSILEGLKDNNIYNYDYLYDVKVSVKANQKNINKLKSNADRAYDEFWEEDNHYSCDTSYYENEIENYKNRVADLETELNFKEEELIDVKNQVEELQEYKDRVQGIIGE